MQPTLELTLSTPRLLLRRFNLGDAPRVAQIQSNWNVMRMLRLATFPVTLASTRAWLSDHSNEWLAGEAFRFAVVWNEVVIGCVDVDEIADGRGALGYWFDEAVWGQGLGGEAARAVVDWAFADLGLSGLDSGCASDNPASAAVLTKLGFRRTGEAQVWSKPRAAPITQLRFALEAPAQNRMPGLATQ